MEPVLAPSAEIFALNSRLLLNCIDGVSDEHANKRPLPDANSMAFLVAHLINVRHFMLKLMGTPLANPLEASLGNVRSVEEAKGMPPLAELRKMWIAVAEHLERSLEAATAESLANPIEPQFPVQDRSLLGGIAFLAQHESFHVGQLAILRKGLGYPAMSYAPPE